MSLCTSPQHNLVRVLLRQLELPIDRVTVMHRDLFKASGIAWNEGRDLCAEISALTSSQARVLIGHLQQRAA